MTEEKEKEETGIHRKLTPEERERFEEMKKIAVEAYADALRYLAER